MPIAPTKKIFTSIVAKITKKIMWNRSLLAKSKPNVSVKRLKQKYQFVLWETVKVDNITNKIQLQWKKLTIPMLLEK